MTARRLPIVAALAAGIAAGALVTLLITRGSDGDGPNGPPELSLAEVQRAVDSAGGYVIELRTANLVLPRWGGTDDGTVTVGARGDTAEASLRRTGDGDYTIVAYGNETFFRRSTCPSFTRISGGGAEVLALFLWSRTAVFRNGELLRVENGEGDSAVIVARLEGLGEVRIEVERGTMLPSRITRDASAGTPFEILVRDWGSDRRVDRPAATGDGGPGGNPC